MNSIDLYANENFPFEMVIALRQCGYDITTTYEAGQANQGIPDDEVLVFAQQQNRTVITLNRDDFVKLHRSGVRHYGIVICKDDRDYSGQVQTLHTYFQSQSDLTNRAIRVKKQNQPKSSSPIFIVQEYGR
jgi:predicted nuclease of predicted toxin-antitoxin system